MRLDKYFALWESDAWNKARVRMIQYIRKAKLDDDWFENLGDALEISEAAKDNYNKWDEQFREILALFNDVYMWIIWTGN